MRKKGLASRGRTGGHARARALSAERRSEIARRAALARWERVHQGRMAAAPAPAVLRRLRALLGDDGRGPSKYGSIKAIVFGAPVDWMSASLVLPSAIPDPARDFFRRANYSQILKRIEDERQQVESFIFQTSEEKTRCQRQLRAFERLVYEALMDAPELEDQERRFRWRITLGATPPEKGEKKDKKRSLEPSALHIQLWTCPKQDEEEPRLLGEEVLPFEGDFSSKFEQAADRFSSKFSQAVDRLLRAHCQMAELLLLRFRRDWWTKRHSPAGFPVVTGYLVPRLYDYLRPSYPVKRYRMTPSGGGAYPQQLMRDIADILQLERPDLCSARPDLWSALTPSQVRAAVERYLKRADQARPMGEAMFQVRSQYRWTGREAVPVEPAITGSPLS